MLTAIIFWSAIALILYAYFGYGLALAALSLLRSRPVRRGTLTPPVSFIVTAHNEKERIRHKIDNTLQQDYPPDAFEVIVASDCSTDGTDAIVSAYAPRVRLVRATERRGKEAAQQLAVNAASGQILIFSDVATALAPDGISSIVQNFADPTVGCVSSVDRFVDADGVISGEGAYVRYEMLLRSLETRVNSLVGLSGSFFAARRDVCGRWAADRQSDFTTLLHAIELGWRGVHDPCTAGYYRNIADERREFQRKVRTVTRGIAVVGANLRMLNPFRYGLFAWQLASHKLCRWLVPFAMIAAFAASAMLATQSPWFAAAFALQAAFYAMAAAGFWSRAPLLRLPSFLVIANLAVLIAWIRFIRGERFVVWTPSERIATLPRTTL